MFFISDSQVKTHKFASSITEKFLIENETLIFLINGELGVGKTEFVKGVASKLGFSHADITSPTFVMVNELENNRYKMYHIDLYRVEKKFARSIVYDLLEETQFSLTNKKIVVCIEWANKLLKKREFKLNVGKVVMVDIKVSKNNIRTIKIKF
ncbi:MAG: tRNA (adenosine(37)-N6)-threonylcarbamoyltransferase complex ATPase subunit type 1 TsaE [Elusimicrobiota bacterium]|nr:tRNA (adenosine(37)-N6)-threonylcarbamoyltransferase complex ATPase subunit type 1 TsaE [Endomicrobiia bacterium]MDW8055896.1 tRNA (adenosine(37)-N6)-threonylcarbamoyltransferase complex ATPase subunit type 1 TsaE [Elusimicrobiota bacterium]